MEKISKTLLLFTGEFPYGKRGEPFLEDEIIYLSREFNTIYVLPRKKSSLIRPLPKNVLIVDDLTDVKIKIRKQSKINLLKALFAILKEAVITQKGYLYFLSLKHFLYIWFESLSISKKLLIFVNSNNLNNSVFYNYWSDSSLLACAMLKKQDLIKRLITRTHRFDLYDSRAEGNLIPFRNYKYKQTDKIYCISKHGQNYLYHKTPKNIHSKISLSYLGVNFLTSKCKKKIPKSPIIVTCARMEYFKRISLMPKILNFINTPIHWVHFGDGAEFEVVDKASKTLPSNIEVTLMGQKNNYEILEYYQKNNVSLFVSLSTSEGLPVSMMEAISYGIPILATKINGVPEIVTSKTGILLDMNESNKSIAAKIEYIINKNPFKYDDIIDFYKDNFNAEINYTRFAKEISTLK